MFINFKTYLSAQFSKFDDLSIYLCSQKNFKILFFDQNINRKIYIFNDMQVYVNQVMWLKQNLNVAIMGIQIIGSCQLVAIPRFVFIYSPQIHRNIGVANNSDNCPWSL